MVKLHKSGIPKELCEYIDDFVPLKPVKYENRWTKLVLKMAHRRFRDIRKHFTRNLASGLGIIKEHITNLSVQWIRTRAFTRIQYAAFIVRDYEAVNFESEDDEPWVIMVEGN